MDPIARRSALRHRAGAGHRAGKSRIRGSGVPKSVRVGREFVIHRLPDMRGILIEEFPVLIDLGAFLQRQERRGQKGSGERRVQKDAVLTQPAVITSSPGLHAARPDPPPAVAGSPCPALAYRTAKRLPRLTLLKLPRDIRFHLSYGDQAFDRPARRGFGIGNPASQPLIVARAWSRHRVRRADS